MAVSVSPARRPDAWGHSAAPAPRRAAPDRDRRARPKLEVVRPGTLTVRQRRRRARALGTAAVTLLVAFLFGMVAAHAVLAEGQVQLDALQVRAGEEQSRYARLRLQVAELESPERVVAAAQQRLGMVPPPGVTYLSPRGPENGVVRTTTRVARRGTTARTPVLASATGAWSRVKPRLATR